MLNNHANYRRMKESPHAHAQTHTHTHHLVSIQHTLLSSHLHTPHTLTTAPLHTTHTHHLVSKHHPKTHTVNKGLSLSFHTLSHTPFSLHSSLSFIPLSSLPLSFLPLSFSLWCSGLSSHRDPSVDYSILLSTPG